MPINEIACISASQLELFVVGNWLSPHRTSTRNRKYPPEKRARDLTMQRRPAKKLTTRRSILIYLPVPRTPAAALRKIHSRWTRPGWRRRRVERRRRRCDNSASSHRAVWILAAFSAVHCFSSWARARCAAWQSFEIGGSSLTAAGLLGGIDFGPAVNLDPSVAVQQCSGAEAFPPAFLSPYGTLVTLACDLRFETFPENRFWDFESAAKLFGGVLWADSELELCKWFRPIGINQRRKIVFWDIKSQFDWIRVIGKTMVFSVNWIEEKNNNWKNKIFWRSSCQSTKKSNSSE